MATCFPLSALRARPLGPRLGLRTVRAPLSSASLSSRSAGGVLEAGEDVDDVAADDVEAVAALLHEQRRPAEPADRLAQAGEVVALQFEAVRVLGGGVDAERHH